MPVFSAVLFTIAKGWKKTKCPSADKWINKMWLFGLNLSLQNSCVDSQPLVFKNVILFRNQVVTEVISSDGIILEQVGPLIQCERYLYTDGKFGDKQAWRKKGGTRRRPFIVKKRGLN